MSLQILNLNPCYDHWVIISQPPKIPNVLRGDHVVKLVDGKGLNIARVFSTLGFRDYMCINILGGEVGRIISSKCREEGINSLEFWIEDESRINTAVVYEYERRMLMINEPGPFMQRSEIEHFIEFLASSLKKGTVVISGSAPQGFQVEDMERVAKIAREASCRLMVDISGEWLKSLMVFEPEMVKVNAEEFKLAFDINELTLKEMLRIKKAFNVGVLCVTLGKDGSITISEDAVIHAKPRVVHTDFSVGSGDSFFAGYLYSEALGKPLRERILFATACGITNTLKYGAAIFDAEDIKNQLSNVIILEEKL